MSESVTCWWWHLPRSGWDCCLWEGWWCQRRAWQFAPAEKLCGDAARGIKKTIKHDYMSPQEVCWRSKPLWSLILEWLNVCSWYACSFPESNTVFDENLLPSTSCHCYGHAASTSTPTCHRRELFSSNARWSLRSLSQHTLVAPTHVDTDLFASPWYVKAPSKAVSASPFCNRTLCLPESLLLIPAGCVWHEGRKFCLDSDVILQWDVIDLSEQEDIDNILAFRFLCLPFS